MHQGYCFGFHVSWISDIYDGGYRTLINFDIAKVHFFNQCSGPYAITTHNVIISALASDKVHLTGCAAVDAASAKHDRNSKPSVRCDV